MMFKHAVCTHQTSTWNTPMNLMISRATTTITKTNDDDDDHDDEITTNNNTDMTTLAVWRWSAAVASAGNPV